MDTTKGAIVVDKDNVSHWSPSGQIPDGTTATSNSTEEFRVEKYTGTLDR